MFMNVAILGGFLSSCDGSGNFGLGMIRQPVREVLPYLYSAAGLFTEIYSPISLEKLLSNQESIHF